MRQDFINDAEGCIIGGLMLYPAECEQAIFRLLPDDFANTLYAEAFDRMRQMHKENKRIDSAVLLSGFEGDERGALANCAEQFISLAGYEDYISTVRKYGSERRIKTKLTTLVLDDSENLTSEVEKILAEEKKRMEAESLTGMMDRQITDFINNLFDDTEKEKRIYTGFLTIDRCTAGFRRSTVSIVGARPSTGKTALALNIIRNQMKNTDNRVLLFSLEMSCRQIYERLLSDMLGISYARINDGNISKEDKNQMVLAVNEIYENERLLVADTVYTVEGMEALISRFRPAFVVVDFIQLVRTMRSMRDRRLEIDYISSEFKRMAKLYGCHILLLSQLSRSGTEAPRMSDLKESGGLEQDGDYILMLHRPYVLDKNSEEIKPETTYLMIDKNKYGRTGAVEMNFSGEYQRFTEVEKRF